MTGNERGLLEVFLERQDEAIARLDMRLSALESKHLADQAANNARFSALEHNLDEIVKKLDAISGTLNKLDGAADAANWVVDNKGKILAGLGVVFMLFEVATRIIVLWPLR